MDLPTIDSLGELEKVLAHSAPLFVRYSEGWEKDSEGGSMDAESGLELPGLSFNPLSPEPWWSRPVADWLARQLCQYKELREKNPRRIAWIAKGLCIARGPDCEPLLVQVEPMARLSETLLAEAERHYQQHFDAGRGPED